MKTTVGKWASYIYVEPWSDDFRPLTTKTAASGAVYLDYCKDGELVGIEILEPLDVIKVEDDV